MKTYSRTSSSEKRASGFTLVELMISLSLGLGLVTLVVGTIDKLSRVTRISAEATEATERGYFLIDAIDVWVAQTATMMSEQWLVMNPPRVFKPQRVDSAFAWPDMASPAHSIATAELGDSSPSVLDVGPIDFCQTPDVAPLPLETSGIALIDGQSLPCVPQRHLETSQPILLLERRRACWGNCTEAGFYAFSSACFGVEEMPFLKVGWLEAGRERPQCFSDGGAIRITRTLIYIRDYAWRVGDSINALMLRELAHEPDARWLRSSMLAHDIDDWRVDCVFGCRLLERNALLARAIDLSFATISGDQSIAIHRVLTPRGKGYLELLEGERIAHSSREK